MAGKQSGGAASLVRALPGLSSALASETHSGYLRVAESGSNLFYVFVEREDGAADSPIIVWGQGGPGCSSMLGLFTEFGPWRPLSGSKLVPNDKSWTKVASVLFIDSPAGAGYSFTSGKPRRTDDENSAQDFVAALSLFFEMHPEKSNVPFYLASESYGGHFVPQQADLLLNAPNLAHLSKRFAGIMLGNPYVSWESADLAFAHTLWGRQLVSAPLWREFETKRCSLFGVYTAASYPIECLTLLEAVIAQKDAGIPYTLNPYDLIDPTCSSGSYQSRRVMQLPSAGRNATFRNSARGRELLRGSIDVNTHQDPCVEFYLVAYLNRPDVLEALHVDKSAPAWVQCSDELFYNWPSADSHTDTTKLLLKVVQQTRGSPFRTLVFSGDADGVCPTIGTQNFIWNLAAAVPRRAVEVWEPWLDSTNQTGGFVAKFEGQFSFATVHAAGHMVAGTQPLRALSLVTAFLAGNNQLFANSSSFTIESSASSAQVLSPSESFSIAVAIIAVTAIGLLLFVAGMQRVGSKR